MHGDATEYRKDSGVFVGGECPIGQDSSGICAGAEALEQKFRTGEQCEKEGDCGVKERVWRQSPGVDTRLSLRCVTRKRTSDREGELV